MYDAQEGHVSKYTQNKTLVSGTLSFIRDCTSVHRICSFAAYIDWAIVKRTQQKPVSLEKTRQPGETSRWSSF